MDDTIDSLGDAKLFSGIDALQGFWKIPMASEDLPKTVLTMHKGMYKYVRMPFGLRNASATFQRNIDVILSGVKWRSCLCYLDDIIAFSSSFEQYLVDVDEVLGILRVANVQLNPSKCTF